MVQMELLCVQYFFLALGQVRYQVVGSFTALSGVLELDQFVVTIRQIGVTFVILVSLVPYSQCEIKPIYSALFVRCRVCLVIKGVQN